MTEGALKPFNLQTIKLLDYQTALVHKSENRWNPSNDHEQSGDLIALGHAEVRHLIQSGTADPSLRGLGFDQTCREMIPKDGF